MWTGEVACCEEWWSKWDVGNVVAVDFNHNRGVEELIMLQRKACVGSATQSLYRTAVIKRSVSASKLLLWEGATDMRLDGMAPDRTNRSNRNNT